MSFDDDAADRLNAYLDAHALGRSDDPGGLDPDVISTHDRIERLAGGILTDQELKVRLWRSMMEAFPAVQPRIAGRETPERATMISCHPGAGGGRGHARRAPRAIFGAVATAALILVSAIGISLFNRPTNDAGQNVAQIAAPGTPAADSTPALCSKTFVSNTLPVEVALSAFVQEAVSEQALAANVWQMQGWTIAPGGVSAFSQSGPSVAFDFVLDGFYSAVFGSSAEVNRHIAAEKGFMPFSPNKVVELGYGDAVGFDPSKGVVIRNLSTTNALTFKRAVFSIGPPNGSNTATPSATGAHVVLDASGHLPPEIGTVNKLQNGPLRLKFYFRDQPICVDQGEVRLNEPAGASYPLDGGYVLII